MIAAGNFPQTIWLSEAVPAWRLVDIERYLEHKGRGEMTALPVLPRAAPLDSGEINSWSAKITAAYQKTVKGIFEVGRLLIEAKTHLPHGSFKSMIEGELPFGPSEAQRYMRVARNPRFANPAHVQHLPASISTLCEIEKLPDDVYARLLSERTIRPGMQRGCVTKINANIRTQANHKQIRNNARMHDLGGRIYNIGVADPPHEGNISRPENTDPFPRLTVEQICAFQVDDGRPLREVFAKNAIVYLWVIDQHLFSVPLIFAAWGFEFKRTMSWPRPSIGLGQYVRTQHETVCIGVRGHFAAAETGLRHSSLIIGESLPDGLFRCALPHDQRHSSKPPRLQEMIERAYPEYFTPDGADDPVAIELFSRVYRPGWAGQGWEYPGRPRSNVEQSATHNVATATPSGWSVNKNH
jgi:N6-adenosine-specific RNA methylase IME4